jgi:chemotaxis protein MotB
MADKGSHVIIITKKSRGHPAHHGGAWKVAYADFMTAMMCLFLVLWLVSQTDTSARDRISQYFRTGMMTGAPSILPGGAGIAESAFLDTEDGVFRHEQSMLMEAASSLQKALEEASKGDKEVERLSKQMDVQVTEQGLLIQIIDGGDELLFDVSSAELKPKLKRLLELIAPLLGRLQNSIQMHGHTDARPFPEGTNRSNWDLSFERADAARRILEGSGTRPGQISGVFAHGSSTPYIQDDPFSPKNRRLAILAVRRTPDPVVSRAKSALRTGAPIQKTVARGVSEPPAPPAAL